MKFKQAMLDYYQEEESYKEKKDEQIHRQMRIAGMNEEGIEDFFKNKDNDLENIFSYVVS
jgi:t-SNARE complex subunit (syntaxin)